MITNLVKLSKNIFRVDGVITTCNTTKDVKIIDGKKYVHESYQNIEIELKEQFQNTDCYWN